MTSDEPAARDRLPDEVRALLRERIESYEELEALLALERLRGTGRTAEELSGAVHVDVPLIERALRSLEARALIERRAPSAQNSALRPEPRYFYAPASTQLDSAVRALAMAYAEQPIPIIKIMSENAIQRLRTGAARAFADAFILRKDKNGS
jgi:DNA-binding MarR family transcriptional regulator